MKILVSTPVFMPMVGGMETMADNLAVHFKNKGHQVQVVTPIEYTGPEMAAYAVLRKPSWLKKMRAVKNADIVYSNGASLYCVFWSMIFRKKFVWTHTGYQVSCIDGLGWHKGAPAPISPLRSFFFHLKTEGLFKASRGIAKVMALRFVAKNYAAKNVAISDWMVSRQPLPRQIRIHNPFPINKFVNPNSTDEIKYDFIFLGRLVSEKGVNTLINAFASVAKSVTQKVKLCIIGDGAERKNLEALVAQLEIRDQVEFKGQLTGASLLDAVAAGRIAIVPSAWEEPFGGVATELMAAGKNLIVSKYGALAELVKDAGLVFENGNHIELATQMKKLLNDKQLQTSQRLKFKERLKSFVEEYLVDDYINVFNNVIAT